MTKLLFQKYITLKQVLVLLVISGFASCGKSGGAEGMAAAKPEVDFFEAKIITGQVEKNILELLKEVSM